MRTVRLPSPGRDLLARFIFATLVTALGAESPYLSLQLAQKRFAAIPTQATLPADNPTTPAKVALGAALFLEPQIVGDGTQSCGDCHGQASQAPTGSASVAASPGALALTNTVFNTLWPTTTAVPPGQVDDGSAPLLNETSEHPTLHLEALPADQNYAARFAAAFPDDPAPVNLTNASRALQCYQATLITPGARFDRYLTGVPNALTTQEVAGLSLFLVQGCAFCHNGVNLGGNALYTFDGPLPASAALKPLRRVAPLRNALANAPYFHNRSVRTLPEAVRIMGDRQLGLTLTPAETDAIVAFLASLSSPSK